MGMTRSVLSSGMVLGQFSGSDRPEYEARQKEAKEKVRFWESRA